MRAVAAVLALVMAAVSTPGQAVPRKAVSPISLAERNAFIDQAGKFEQAVRQVQIEDNRVKALLWQLKVDHGAEACELTRALLWNCDAPPPVAGKAAKRK